MTSRTRERPATPAPDAELTALGALYARHAPDLLRVSGDHLPVLLSAARGHLELARRRGTAEPLIRVRDADPAVDDGDDRDAGDDDGAPRTARIVEIVTDDMPFLVESLQAAVGRAGGEVSRLIHPIVVVRGGSLRRAGRDAHRRGPDLPAARVARSSPGSTSTSPAAPAAGPRRELASVLRRRARTWSRTPADGGQALELADAMPTLPVTPTAPARPTSAGCCAGSTDGNFTFLGYRYQRRPRVASLESREPGLRAGRLRRHIGLRRVVRPGSAPADAELGLLRHHPGQRAQPAAPGAPVLRRCPHASTPTGRLVGEHRFLGMLTVPALHESVLDIPVVERRVRAAIQRGRVPAGVLLRPADAGGDLRAARARSCSARRRSDLHDTAVGVLAGRRAARGAAVPARRPVPAVHLLPGLPAPRPVHHVVPAGHGRGPARASSAAARSTTPPGSRSPNLALVHFTVHADADARRLRRGRRRGAAGRAHRGRPHLGRPACCPDAGTAEVAAAAAPACPRRTRPPSTPRDAVEDLRRIAAPAPAPATSTCGSTGAGRRGRRRRRRPAVHASTWPARRSRCPRCCRCCSSLGVDVLDERPSEFVRAGRRCAAGSTTSACASTTRPARRSPGAPSDDVESGFCAAFRAAWRGDAESDRFNALVLRAGLHWREVAVLRAYARYAAPARQPVRPAVHRPTPCSRIRTSARALVALFRARFDPARGRHARAAPAVAALGRACAALIDAVTGLDADRILRGYLALITATLRTNWFQRAGRTSRSRSTRGGAGHAGAAAAVRDLRVLAADGGRAPAVRAGRPRRAALVGPPAGLPHRDPRPGQGAGGEERGDRAGRREGRVRRARRAADAAADRSAGASACYRMFISGLLDLTDNLRRRRETVPPPDVVRHDGDDSYLVVAADKGTATVLRHRQRGRRVLRLLARRRVRLRRLGRLRPQGHGHHRPRRLGERQAALPGAGRRHPDRGLHRASASATCPATCSATACCCPSTSGWSPRSTTGTCSSTPTRTPASRFAERERLFALPRSSLGRLRPRGDQPGRRGVAAHGEVGPDRPGDARRARPRRRTSPR